MDIEKLKALALAATPGEWEVDTIKSEGEYGTDEDGGRGFMAYVVTDAKGRPLVDSLNRDDSSIHVDTDGEYHYAWDELAKRDCEFIAAANPATVLELIAEVEQLRAEVKEWLCIDCNTAYPGPPRPGFACVICPKCKGTTMPRQRAEIEKLRAELASAKSASEVAETRMDAGSNGGAGLAAPAAGTVEKDAERYRALHTLMQNAKGSASIEVNQHLAYYETAEPGQEVKLQWYPDTPIGFYTIEGATLDAVADEAVEYVRANTKAGKDSA